MSFAHGFEKTAWNPMTGVGQVAKGVSNVGSAIKKTTSNIMAGGKAARMEGFRGAETGAGLGASRVRKAAETGAKAAPQAQTRLDVSKRMSRMQTSKADAAAKAKPSFARKHPFVTAGALYLGAKSAFSGGDSDKKPAPQLVQPQ
jgi:hypothetical protein